jgi:hypothetical protein
MVGFVQGEPHAADPDQGQSKKEQDVCNMKAEITHGVSNNSVHKQSGGVARNNSVQE